MAKSKLTVTERFWAKVKKGSGCWEWQAGKFRANGYFYGAFKMNGKLKKAHRVSWELTHGEIPFGMFVCHHCDNPPCVRPSHLFLGTNSDNQKDAVRKGRGSKGNAAFLKKGDDHWTRRRPDLLPDQRGELNRYSKLKDSDVREIRRLRAEGEPLKSLAATFGVAFGTISKIARGDRWKHVK